jgi:NHLM bacteriocin system ABC transporter peptidase/ATP-binding protein
MSSTAPDTPSRPKTRFSKRVRTPTVLQMEAVECGAAALSIILSHYRKFVPLEELRITCGVSRDGSKASNVVKAARVYGLNAKGYKKEPEELSSLPMPLIAFWNFNHFLVIEGFGKNKVYLNDPASGPRTVGYEEFDQSFTGVVLAFEKGEKFAPGGARPSVWRSLFERLTGSRLSLVFLGLCTLALVIPGLIVPVFSRVFVDRILVGGNPDWLFPLLGAMAATAGLLALLVFLQSEVLLRLQSKMSLTSSSQFVWHIFQLPMEFFSQRYAGDVIQRIESNSQVAALLSGGLSTNVVNLLMIGFYAYLMFRYDVWLTSIGVTVAVLNLLVLRWVSRARTDENRRIAQEQGKFGAVAMTGLHMIETLKATGGEHGFFSRWSGFQAKLLNSSQRFAASSLWLSTAPALLGALNSAAILGVGGFRVMDGALTIGMFIAFQSLMGSFMSPVSGLLGLGSSVQSLQGALTRLDDVLKYPVDTDIDEQAEPVDADGPTKLEGEIELRNLTFGYSRLESPLIKNFNLHVQPGQRVALVGSSGSGKSTVAKIVSGLYKPWDGEVLFDGKPRQELPRSLINSSVALVDQDIALFQGSVRDNVTMWDSTIDDRDVMAAAKDACIHEDINDRPGGYDQKLEEGGGNLSGGQRQRLEIARALAGNPRILILDEATSALDPRTEERVTDHLRRRGCTLLIIAHRLSTIRDCDEIIVMQYGRIVQRGTHDEMIRVQGPYASLIHAG